MNRRRARAEEVARRGLERPALLASLVLHGLLAIFLLYHLVLFPPGGERGARQARIEPELDRAESPAPLIEEEIPREEPETEAEPEAPEPRVEDDLVLPAPWLRPRETGESRAREDLKRASEVVRRSRPLPKRPPEEVPVPEEPREAANTAAAIERSGTPRVGAEKLRDHCPSPAYPRQAIRRGLEGRVVMIVDVGEDGTVLDVSLQTSSGHDLLDRAAIEAVRNWRFVPAREEERPVRDRLRIPISFRLPR